MTSVRYIGQHDAVDVPLPDGRELRVEHGDTLETSDEHAASLLEQETNWQAVTAKPPKGKGD